jgi:LysR family transcriptional regulator, benzoate and cis,cis-muconate-responsive activator of ben and cat genes
METRLLRTFVALAEERHFGRAARRLHLSTPAVSQQIRKLERLAGTALFERSPIGLTAAGEALLPDARRTVRAAEQAEARLSGLRRHGDEVLRVGVLSHGGGEIMGAAIGSFTAHHRSVRVTVHGLDFPDAATAVLDGRVDVAFVRPRLDDGRLREDPVVTEARFAILPACDDRAHLPAVGIEDLDRDLFLGPADGSPWAYRSFLHLLEDRNGESPRLVDSQCRRAEEFLTAVGAGLGIASTVASFARHYAWPAIAYVPIRDAAPATTTLITAVEDRRTIVEAFRNELDAITAAWPPFTSPAGGGTASAPPRR